MERCGEKGKILLEQRMWRNHGAFLSRLEATGPLVAAANPRSAAVPSADVKIY